MRVFLNHIKIQLKEENSLIYNIDKESKELTQKTR